MSNNKDIKNLFGSGKEFNIGIVLAAVGCVLLLALLVIARNADGQPVTINGEYASDIAQIQQDEELTATEPVRYTYVQPVTEISGEDETAAEEETETETEEGVTETTTAEPVSAIEIVVETTKAVTTVPTASNITVGGINFTVSADLRPGSSSTAKRFNYKNGTEAYVEIYSKTSKLTNDEFKNNKDSVVSTVDAYVAKSNPDFKRATVSTDTVEGLPAYRVRYDGKINSKPGAIEFTIINNPDAGAQVYVVAVYYKSVKGSFIPYYSLILNKAKVAE